MTASTVATPVVPRPAATVMLLRDDPGLEVLLLERSSALSFVPGAHVFPGGAVSPGDELGHGDGGLHPDEASVMLGVAGLALSFWMAAIRECFEETGVLLATAPDGSMPDSSHPALADADRVRAALELGEMTLAEHLERHGLRPALDALAYVAHWITPEVSPRRYDTRFFATRMPPGQQIFADGGEAVAHSWWRPEQALAEWEAGRIELITPTAASLRLLGEFATVAEAIEAFHAGARSEGRVTDPAGGVRVPIPTDDWQTR